MCDANHYGLNCAKPCSCFAVHTEVCDNVNGTCQCKNGWEGSICDQNINECSLETTTCPSNSSCEDTQGSFICQCISGFRKTSEGQCEGKT